MADSLDRLALQRGTSRAEVIVEAARHFVLRAEPGRGSILNLAGIGRGGHSDIAERHDDYLIEDEIDGWKR